MNVVRRGYDKIKLKKPWIFYLPRGIQANPAGVFIGMMLAIVGLAGFLGLAEPTTITKALPFWFYTAWAFSLIPMGIGLVIGVIKRDQLWERFTSRSLSILIGVYALWALSAVGPGRAAVTLAFAMILMFVLEVRIGVINVLINPLQYMKHIDIKLPVELEREEDDGHFDS